MRVKPVARKKENLSTGSSIATIRQGGEFVVNFFGRNFWVDWWMGFVYEQVEFFVCASRDSLKITSQPHLQGSVNTSLLTADRAMLGLEVHWTYRIGSSTHRFRP